MRIHAPEAWDVERGSENVTIAIIDTGIDFAHEDLAETTPSVMIFWKMTRCLMMKMGMELPLQASHPQF